MRQRPFRGARRLLAMPALLWLLALSGGCRDNPAGPPQPEEAALFVSADLAGTSVHSVVLEVSAADIPDPLVFNLEIRGGTAGGTVRVPPGTARTLRISALAANGEVTHEGSHTTDVRRGENPPLRFVLWPTAGDVPVTVTVASYRVEITPAQAELRQGDTLRLTATIRDAEGRAVEGQVEWATLDPAVATVSRQGLVAAGGTGHVQIVASYGRVAGRVRLAIRVRGQIAFVNPRVGSGDIFVVGADGSGLDNLSAHPAADLFPAWSPNGRSIAFQSRRDGNEEVYVMDADGSNPVNLTNHPGRDGLPAWSPDGGRIAFATDRNGRWDIYVMGADGSNPTLLVERAAAPIWSPDGHRIAFLRPRVDYDHDIWVINADGSNPQLLAEQAAHPAWAPDGSRIAFYHDGDIYRINADGTNPQRLTATRGHSPAWSPDGSRIAFAGQGVGDEAGIFAIGADGSGEVQLAGGRSTAPAWAPDGSRIAYVRDENSLWLVNADGQEIRFLINGSSPAWRP